MSRLTDIRKRIYNYELDYSRDEISKIICKLGQLEDLEEELGCSLECVAAAFKAMKQDHIYCDTGIGMYELYNFALDYVDIADDENYMRHFTRTDYHYVLDDDCTIFVEDYKKTWWLTEIKERLVIWEDLKICL